MITIGAKEAEVAKETGITLAAEKRAEILQVGRGLAETLAKKNGGRTNAEDVVIELEKQGYDSRDLGPAAGALFRGKKWRFTGEWHKPVRVNAHASQIRVWMWVV
jgi:hypothetical protein